MYFVFCGSHSLELFTFIYFYEKCVLKKVGFPHYFMFR